MQVNRNSSIDTSGINDSAISLHTAQSNFLNMSSTGTESNVFTQNVTTENNQIESQPDVFGYQVANRDSNLNTSDLDMPNNQIMSASPLPAEKHKVSRAERIKQKNSKPSLQHREIKELAEEDEEEEIDQSGIQVTFEAPQQDQDQLNKIFNKYGAKETSDYNQFNKLPTATPQKDEDLPQEAETIDQQQQEEQKN